MGVRTEGDGHSNNWKLLIGLSVLCGVLVFLGGFLHRRALDAAIADRQAKSVALVNTKVATAAKHADLSGPMKDAEAAHFTKSLDLPAGTDLRLFSTAGAPVYGSPGSAPFPADTEGIQAAVSGYQGRVVDGSDLRIYTAVPGKGAKPAAIAAVVANYTQLRHDAAGPLDAVRLPIVALGIVLLVAGLLLMLQATKRRAPAKAPAKPSGKPGERKSGPSSSKGRVTGFDPVPVTVGRAFDAPAEQMTDQPEPVAPAAVPDEPAPAAEPALPGRTLFGMRLGSKKDKNENAAAGDVAREEAAAPSAGEPAAAKPKRSLFSRKEASVDTTEPAQPQDDKTTSALEREIAIRQALEDQLEQLRTRIQMQEVETNNATKQLVAQLESANRRAEEAEARATGGTAPTVAPAPTPPAIDEAAVRLQQLEREIAEARSVTADAVARAETLQRQLDEASAPPVAPAPDTGAEAKIAEAMAQLADAQQRATAAEQRSSAAEQRAASVESVREELEVRVAQLGTKASELEQRATELETSLNEANAGGDAVRAEIATLTAALAAANARISELESVPAPPVHNEQDQAEIARLRGELASHMERAQVAEERATTLEADLVATQRGVSALQNGSNAAEVSETAEAKPEPVEELSLASRFAPDEPEASTIEPESVAAPGGPEMVVAREHEPQVHEPEVHEPEVHESEVHEPEVHEPKADERINLFPAFNASANAASDVAAEPEVAEPVEASTTAPLNIWASLAQEPRSQEPVEPASAVADVDPDDAEHSDSVGVLAPEPDRIESEMREPEPVQSDAGLSRLRQPEVDEPASVGAETAEAEGIQPSVPEPEPVEPESREPEPAVADVATPEPAPTVEWHAPSSAPAPTAKPTTSNGNGIAPAPAAAPSASNGNGVPPAPSDDARYDDIWTAAFAAPEPPEPEPALENGEAHARSLEASHSESQPEQPETVASAARPEQPDSSAPAQSPPPVNDASPDDQPSPPEDEISAEDDMWSLRARLADAATRKQLPHQID